MTVTLLVRLNVASTDNSVHLRLHLWVIWGSKLIIRECENESIALSIHIWCRNCHRRVAAVEWMLLGSTDLATSEATWHTPSIAMCVGHCLRKTNYFSQFCFALICYVTMGWLMTTTTGSFWPEVTSFNNLRLCSNNLRLWSNNLRLWSNNLRLWSNNIRVWSNNLRLWSSNLRLWSNNLRLWSNNLRLWSNNLRLYVLSTMGVSKESISKFLIGNRFHVKLRILSPENC